jgi:DNA-binding GntR family transcriptional regulator
VDVEEGGPEGITFRTKQDYVAARLRQGILSGRYAPGQRLQQEDIAKELSVSWTPVREALRKLEAEGWLTVGRHRGAVVTQLSPADFEDIYLLRLENEPYAARLSAERMDVATLRRLDALFHEMSALELGSSEHWPTLLRLEREFHETQYRTIGRPRLKDLVMNLRDASERYLRTYYLLPEERSQHGRTHSALLAALRRGDGAAADLAIRKVLERVLVKMKPALSRASVSETPAPAAHERKSGSTSRRNGSARTRPTSKVRRSRSTTSA